MPTDDSCRRGPYWRRLAALALLVLSLGAQGQTLESVLAPGPVIQGHVKVENDCKSCHVPFDRAAQDRLCVECHKDVGKDVREHSGWHGRREPQACRTCHTEHRGRNAQLAAFDRKTFDHRGTDFALLDKHASVDCAKCHLANKRWREAPGRCIDCHQRDDTHKGSLGAQCQDCHNAKGWHEVAQFDHDKKTRFALEGKHVDTKCEACHPRKQYKDTPRTCMGCHRKNDEHKGQFGEKCESCHGAKAWKPSTFNHDADTKYVLRDKHRAVKCTACHTGPLYRAKLTTACADCHTKDDKHEGSLGKKCEACHSERGWKEPGRFDHDKTRFPLVGGHQKAQCKDCHRDQRFRETPSACVDCHKKNDRHEGTLGDRCADCHIEKDWKTVAGRFDHQKTKFPLINAHARTTVKCQDCHESPKKMRNTPVDCQSCHRRDDRHEGSLGTRCNDCHDDRNWRVERFDHSRTRYPLIGRHAVATCKSCHASLRFRDAPSDCFSCHRKDDTHKATLGTRCDSCHNVRGWALWEFDHRAKTRYPLEGAHAKVRCQACHTQPAPLGKAIAVVLTDCNSCHRKNDVHDGRFGTRCEVCHVPERWAQVRRR